MIVCVVTSSYEEERKEIENLKKEITEWEVLSCENMSADVWRSMPRVQSLFGEKKFYYVQGLEEYDELVDIFFEHTIEYQISEHVFLVSFSSLLKKQKEALVESGAKIIEGKAKEEKEKPSFAFSNAILARDKKKAWQELHVLLQTKTAEEIHGGVWAQMKNLLLVSRHAESELDLHPFVFKNIKNALPKWPEVELLAHAKKIIEMPNKAHAGETVLADELEKWVLSL